MYLGRINSIVKCHAFSSLRSSFSSISLLSPFSLPSCPHLFFFLLHSSLLLVFIPEKILSRTKGKMENQGTQLLPADSLRQVTAEALHKITAQPPNLPSSKATNLSCCMWNSKGGKEELEANVSMQK